MFYYPYAIIPTHINRSFFRRPSKENQKEAEKEKKKKRRKTSTDDEDEREEFQLFLVEERLTVAHRPNSQGSSATSGTLYPALVSGDWYMPSYTPKTDIQEEYLKTERRGSLPIRHVSLRLTDESRG